MSIVGMDSTEPVQLDLGSLQHVFSFLSPNHLVLLAKPLSKHFRQYVERAQGPKASKVDPSSEIPLGALPRLEVGSLKYKQKKQLMIAAAKGGCLQTLQWAREQGCPWDRSVSDAAAEGGHLAVLQWLRQEGCPWGPSTCEAAARGGHLEVLQ